MGKAYYPKPVEELIGELKKLPGIGPRSAERIAIWFLQSKKSNALELSTALVGANELVRSCDVCGFFAVGDACSICDDATREVSALCVVEQATDVISLERASVFKGRYHCLGGKLSPLDNVSPEDLRIGSLLKRVRDQKISEVILALGSDVEGEATAYYLKTSLRDCGCKVTQLAQGLPAGGGLEYADELTLTRALEGRRTME